MKLILSLGVSLTLCGCASTLPKAEAAYGTFVVSEQAAASLIQSPTVSNDTKQKIKAADAQAKPVADALFTALVSCATTSNCAAVAGALNAASASISTFAQEVKP